MKEKLELLKKDALEELGGISLPAELEAFRVKYLGKRDIGKCKKEYRYIRRKIRRRNFTVQLIGKRKRKSVIPGAGSALAHDEPRSHAYEYCAHNSRRERHRIEVRKHRRKKLKNCVEKRIAQRSDDGFENELFSEENNAHKIAGAVKKGRCKSWRYSEPVVYKELYSPDAALGYHRS